jgi:hypothetical protein
VVVATELLEQAAGLAADCGRTDLQRRLVLARQRAQEPGVRVLVVGEPGKGKSQLVNALVGAPVCAVGGSLSGGRGTTAPTVVRNGPEPAATLVLAQAPAAEGGLPGEEAERIAVPVESLARPPAPGSPATAPQLLRVEVQLPRATLAGGLELVDTPGVGGVAPMVSLRTVELLPTADVVLVVTDSSQEFTAPEMDFLRQVTSLCPHVVCAVAKTDVHPEWRRVVDLDRGHLERAGLDVPLVAVSAALEAMAVRQRDAELHRESGFPALWDHLRRLTAAGTGTLAQRSAAHDLTSVTEQLATTLRAELDALLDPAGNDRRVRELEEARGRMEDLGRRSSRWQLMLADGVTDLMADIDYDLRDRSRVIVREAEDAIDADDPGPLWPQMSEWLDQRVAGAVADSYVWATQRSEWLAARVIEQFARDGAVIAPDLVVGDPAEVLGTLVELADIDAGDMTVRERMLIALRGSYTGVLMVGLVTGLAGLALLNPFSVAAGVLLGRKAYKDDADVRRQRRQNEAKAAVRRHLDEVVFQVGKQLKDRLRLVQRTLRDLITDTVQELSRTLAEALSNAQQASRVAAAQREARIRTLRQQVDRVERLAAQVARIDPAPATSR